MTDNIHISENPEQLALSLADQFRDMIVEMTQSREKINIAISGGNTPELFFRTLAAHHSDLPWKNIQIFWVDERCVPSENSESNYGMTRKSLLDKIEIPQENIHYIIGNADPETEARRYGEEISQNVSSQNCWPEFDWILLGLGEDGHTASLFPGSSLLDYSNSNAAVAIQPQTKQKRITLTLPVLNHAKNIIFLVSGRTKAQVIADIFLKNERQPGIPATLIAPKNGTIEWFLDRDAAEILS